MCMKLIHRREFGQLNRYSLKSLYVIYVLFILMYIIYIDEQSSFVWQISFTFRSSILLETFYK